MSWLGQPDSTGIEATMGILREAVELANLRIQQLSEFVIASVSPGK
jgi:hypothetical protein